MYQHVTIKGRIKSVIIVIAVLIWVPLLSNAHTLELGNDNIKIIVTDTIEIKSGTPYDITNENDTIFVIDNIFLTYKDAKKDTLVITSPSDSVFQFKAEITKSLKPNEILKAHDSIPLGIDVHKKYEISHSEKTWSLSFEVTHLAEPIEGERQEEEKSKTPLTYWGCSLLILLIFLLVIFVIRYVGQLAECLNKLFGKGKKKATIQPESTSGNGDPEQGAGPKVVPETDSEEKIQQLKAKIEDLNDDISEKNSHLIAIREQLGLSDGPYWPVILDKIKELQKQPTSNVPQLDESIIKENLAQQYIKTVKESSKGLKTLMEKAEEEVGKNNSGDKSNGQILSKFIKILSSKYKDESPVSSTSREIKEEQLNVPENQVRLMWWCIDQISDRGYKGFDNRKNNIRKDDLFNEIVKALKKPEEGGSQSSEGKKPQGDNPLVSIKVNEGILKTLLPDQQIDSEESLGDALIALAEGSKDEVEAVTSILNEKISSLDAKHQAGGKPKDLIERYTYLREKQLQDKDAEVGRLTDEKATAENMASELAKKNSDLMSATKEMLDTLHADADALENKHLTLLTPCSEIESEQCNHLEERLYNNLVQIAKGLKEFTISEETKPADAKKRIQDKLVSIINEKDSAINTICRYYAYSRLPFMTDNTREFGAIFNRNNMSVLYETINNLFVTFGISFDIPELFVMGVEERSDRYENLTGQGTCSRDIDNLCPNSCIHVDKIDTTNKPSNVIVDIVNVGYSIEGKMAKKTSVLTF